MGTISASKSTNWAPVIQVYIRMRVKEYPEQGDIAEVAELKLRLREEAPRNRKDAPLAGESRMCSKNRFQGRLGNHRSPFRALVVGSSRKGQIMGDNWHINRHQFQLPNR